MLRKPGVRGYPEKETLVTGRKFGGNENQQQRLKKINKRVSDKKSYYRRTYGIELDIQTQGVSSFQTLKEFNAYLRNVNRNLEEKPQVENYQNVHKKLFPIDDVKLAKKEFKRINDLKAARRKEINQHGIVYGGQKMTVEEALKRGDNRFEDLTALKFNLDRYRTSGAFQSHVESMKEIYKGNFIERWDEEYKASYLKALKDKMGVYPELGSEYTRLKKHIENMDIKTFMKFYYTKEFTNITFLYDKKHAHEILSKIIHEWDTPEVVEVA